MPVSELDAPQNGLTLTAEELKFAAATPIKQLVDAVSVPEGATQQLRTPALFSSDVGVDREAGEAGIVRGVVLAQQGVFKTRDRGQFDQGSLQSIANLINDTPGGIVSRLQHASFLDDGTTKVVGKFRSARISTARAPVAGPSTQSGRICTSPRWRLIRHLVVVRRLATGLCLFWKPIRLC